MIVPLEGLLKNVSSHYKLVLAAAQRANELMKDMPYVLLPVANDPRDPEKVMKRLEDVAKKTNREMPTIKVGFERYPLTGITLRDNDVKIHTPEGTFVSYETFIGSLESVIETF